MWQRCPDDRSSTLDNTQHGGVLRTNDINDSTRMFPKIMVPPKWMVKIMENPIKIDDLGVPLFLETPTRRPQMFAIQPQKFRCLPYRMYSGLTRRHQNAASVVTCVSFWLVGKIDLRFFMF